MIIDLERCLGCDACAAACEAAYLTPPSMPFHVVRKVDTDSGRRFLPMLCMQCESPSCMAACGDGAIRIEAGGIVVVDATRCTGCGRCVPACPYGMMRAPGPAQEIREGFLKTTERARIERWQRLVKGGIPAKCELCTLFLAQGRIPRCVASCPVGAHLFGDLDDPDSEAARRVEKGEVYPLLVGKNTRPRVYYCPPDGMTIAEVAALFLKDQ